MAVPKTPTAKRGPFTVDELLAFWKTVVDEKYQQPLTRDLQPGDSIDAGDDIRVEAGNTIGPVTTGLETYTQGMDQMKRVSQAVERTCEAMFFLPWSGQTDEPASGAARATVALTFSRDRRLGETVTFFAGTTFIQETTTDSALVEGVEVTTGRRFTLLENMTFVPGETGPRTATAVAEKAGHGYNNPLPGTLTTIEQPGSGLQNDEATVIPGIPTHRLQVQAEPDVVVPEHVGQYLEFLLGSNAGEVRRVVAYGAADPGVPHGGEAILARTGVFRVSAVTGTFALNEEIEQASTGAKAKFLTLQNGVMVLESTDSLFAIGLVVTGAESGAIATIDFVVQPSSLTAETTTAAWRVLDWEVDLGVTVTNAASPSGGRAAMLDELGAGRRIPRSPGESDDDYRVRAATLPDVVSPNAIRRAGNRVLAPFGAKVCLREAGEPEFPGFGFDLDAFDYDFDQQPSLQFNLLVDYAEFRAFFLVGVPPLNLGEFGLAYDVGATNAYDVSPHLAFYDGIPLTAAVLLRNIYQDIDKRRGGGVGFDLVVDETCV